MAGLGAAAEEEGAAAFLPRGVLWRLAWLCGASGALVQVGRGAAAAACSPDRRVFQGMRVELRAARRSLTASTTLAQDVDALRRLPIVDPALAPAMALRLRGAGWRRAAEDGRVDGGAAGLRRLAAAWQALSLWLRGVLPEAFGTGGRSPGAGTGSDASDPTVPSPSDGVPPGGRPPNGPEGCATTDSGDRDGGGTVLVRVPGGSRGPVARRLGVACAAWLRRGRRGPARLRSALPAAADPSGCYAWACVGDSAEVPSSVLASWGLRVLVAAVGTVPGAGARRRWAVAAARR